MLYEGIKSGGRGAKTGLYKINLPDGDYSVRKLTPIEAERCQTLPDNYTAFGVDDTGKTVDASNTQRYKAIGNGWTVDVISHILRFRNLREGCEMREEERALQQLLADADIIQMVKYKGTEKNVRAFIDVETGGSIRINNIAVAENTKDGTLFVRMPTKPFPKSLGGHKEIVTFSGSKKTALERAVMAMYHANKNNEGETVKVSVNPDIIVSKQENVKNDGDTEQCNKSSPDEEAISNGEKRRLHLTIDFYRAKAKNYNEIRRNKKDGDG